MKAVRIVLIVVGVIIVLFIGVSVFMISQMKTVKTGKVEDSVYAVSHGFVNFFIITDGTNAICVDSGSGAGQTAQETAKLGLKGLNVSAIFLTHSDSDHAGGVDAFPDAGIYLPVEEEQMINGKTKRRIMGKETLNQFGKPHISIEDGQEIRIGGITVKGIATPGHTPGSMCYLVNGKDFFTGDLLVLKNGKAEVTPSYLTMDMAESSNSIRKFARSLTGIRALFTAHGGMTREFDKAVEGFKK